MQLVVIAHNIRSAHNVGSILRTCDGFGVDHVYLSGYTPYPLQPSDTRLPHISKKLTTQISKTALGAEKTMPNSYHQNVNVLLDNLRKQGFCIVALEQAPSSQNLFGFKPPQKTALLLGEEVEGIAANLLLKADQIVEITMKGQKESFNVSVATGIALFAMYEHSLQL